MNSRLYPSNVIGHRGASLLAPENTLAAMRRAAGDGAKMVEVDVKLTAEGRPVLFHDSRLERTTDGLGPVASTTLDTIGALDAGAWFGPEFSGEPVPTLEEALETMLGLGLGVNLEIKPCQGRETETARVTLETARAIWPNDRLPPVISSFSRECLAVARDVHPEWPRALIAEGLPEDWAEAALILDLKAAHVGCKGLTEKDVRTVLDGGREIAVWTVNDATLARTLWSWGVSAIITDDPGMLLGA